MRGTHRCRSGQRHCKGIIPAYAGNTSASRNTHARGEDHPRVCGEHGRSQPDMKSSLGSSPRMRGTRQTYAARWCQRGIIPAYAGNTGGEGAGHGHASGSSPRMRGTHLVVREVVLMAGIIPAYAGNTWSWWCSASIPWDHPRVCGEHLGCLVGRVDGGGIIPAYAGNTSGMRLAHSHWRDHPRVCGEHLRADLCLSVSVGIIPAYAGNTLMCAILSM